MVLKQLAKLGDDQRRQFFSVALGEKLMTRGGDFEDLGFRRDQLYGICEFFVRREAVAAAVHEERGRMQVREMRGSKLRTLFRRMQWVGEKQESIGDLRMGGGEDGRLASAVRVAAEINSAMNLGAQELHRLAKSVLIFFGAAARRRAVWTLLAEGKIAAENSHTGIRKRIRNSDKKRG